MENKNTNNQSNRNENEAVNKQYTALAPYYDRLNSSVDYSAWADFVFSTVEKYLSYPASLVCELGCGTGKLTRLLAERGYDMIGIDNSENMLSIAMQKEYKAASNDDIEPEEIITPEDSDSDIFDCYDGDTGSADIAHRPLYLCQDMRSFELYGTVDAVVCCLDGMNYLTDNGDIEKCFKLVHNYLYPDALFIFDLNTPYKFRNIFASHDFVLEEDGILCAWRNSFDENAKICDFELSLFISEDGNNWIRADEIQKERMYSRNEIESLLKKCGFELIEVSDGDKVGGKIGAPAENPTLENCERWIFVARAVK